MHLDIELPDHGEFYNHAGQKIEFWIDKEDRSKCKILVDGVPLDSAQYEREQAALYGDNVLD